VDLVYFFKEPTFCFINSLYGFFGFCCIDFSSYFYYFSPSICFGFACSCYSWSLRCIIRSLIWDLSVFLICALMAIHFPLRTAFAVSHRFQYVVFSFSLTSRNFLISYFISLMTHCSLSNELFSFQLFACFLSLLLLLSSSFTAL
jgi:hypothetical protein